MWSNSRPNGTKLSTNPQCHVAVSITNAVSGQSIKCNKKVSTVCVCVCFSCTGWLCVYLWVGVFYRKTPWWQGSPCRPARPWSSSDTHTHKETSVSTASNTHDTSASTQKHTLTFTPLFQLVSQKQMLKDNIYLDFKYFSVVFHSTATDGTRPRGRQRLTKRFRDNREIIGAQRNVSHFVYMTTL